MDNLPNGILLDDVLIVESVDVFIKIENWELAKTVSAENIVWSLQTSILFFAFQDQVVAWNNAENCTTSSPVDPSNSDYPFSIKHFPIPNIDVNAVRFFKAGYGFLVCDGVRSKL